MKTLLFLALLALPLCAAEPPLVRNPWTTNQAPPVTGTNLMVSNAVSGAVWKFYAGDASAVATIGDIGGASGMIPNIAGLGTNTTITNLTVLGTQTNLSLREYWYDASGGVLLSVVFTNDGVRYYGETSDPANFVINWGDLQGISAPRFTQLGSGYVTASLRGWDGSLATNISLYGTTRMYGDVVATNLTVRNGFFYTDSGNAAITATASTAEGAAQFEGTNALTVQVLRDASLAVDHRIQFANYNTTPDVTSMGASKGILWVSNTVLFYSYTDAISNLTTVKIAGP